MKNIKVLLLLTFCFILSGCIFEKEVTTVIEVENDLAFSYGNEVFLYDIFHIIDGSIIDNNYALDTKELGEHEIIVNYKNSNKKKEKYNLKYNVIDDIPPILAISQDIYAIKDSSFDIMKKIFLGDNADRKVEYEVIGEYDISQVGNYDIQVNAVDDSDNKTSKNVTIHVIEGGSSSTPSEGTPLDYFIVNYKDDNNLIGIDVSSHQGDIDFEKVKKAGIDFVMIRIGKGPDSEGNMIIDEYFEKNYQHAKAANLKVGVYLYSYATTMDEIDIQVNWIKELLKGKELDYPIAYDWESWNTFYSCNLNFLDLNNLAEKFLKDLNNSGYDVMNYGSKYYLTDIWNLDHYYTWIAFYNDKNNYEKNYKMWQISNMGVVDGIEGFVDINIYNK